MRENIPFKSNYNFQELTYSQLNRNIYAQTLVSNQPSWLYVSSSTDSSVLEVSIHYYIYI